LALSVADSWDSLVAAFPEIAFDANNDFRRDAI
jgi:hypothetical protein